MNKEILVKKIEDALSEKWMGAHCGDFILTMKATGNVITVKSVSTGPSKVMGHWHGRRHHFEVVGDGLKQTKYFCSLNGLARCMAYGYIK